MTDPVVKLLSEKRDARGRFVEILRTEDVGKTPFGQVSLTTALPEQTKGRHYHLRKTEWYCVIRGSAQLLLRSNETGRVVKKNLNDKRLQLIAIPPNWYHEITNTGNEEMYLLVYCNEPFDKKNADTFYEE